MLDYLGRYTHRVAISNYRLLAWRTGVRFRWRDCAHGNRRKIMQLPAGEFLRRFLLHVLPPGFVRIRHNGLLANRHKRQARPGAHRAPLPAARPTLIAARISRSFWLRVAHRDIHRAPSLSHRAHGAHRFASLTARTRTTRATARMNESLPRPRRPASPARYAASGDAHGHRVDPLRQPSVIVVSPTSKPPPTRHEAHARVLPTSSHESRGAARFPPPYKFQSIAF